MVWDGDLKFCFTEKNDTHDKKRCKKKNLIHKVKEEKFFSLVMLH